MYERERNMKRGKERDCSEEGGQRGSERVNEEEEERKRDHRVAINDK